MLTLRQEALQIVNDIPENFLSELVQNLHDFKLKLKTKKESPKVQTGDNKRTFTDEDIQKFLNSCGGIDPKKAAAFAALEELKAKNRKYLTPDTDWERERELAMEEKYGPFN